MITVFGSCWFIWCWMVDPKYISKLCYYSYWSFPGDSDSKESACSAGDLASIPGSGRSSGGGKGNPLQYSCLENPMGWGAWQTTAHGVARVGQGLVTKPPPLTTGDIWVLWPLKMVVSYLQPIKCISLVQ